MTVIAAAVITAGGCATPRYASVRKTPQNPLAEKLQLASRSGPRPSERTMQTLRRYGLADKLAGDQSEVLIELQHAIDRNPLPEAHYAFAELAYLAGSRKQIFDEQAALHLYGAAVTHAYLYLFDERPGFRANAYDPEFRSACDIYNTALESTLRILSKKGSLRPGSHHQVTTGDRPIELAVATCDRDWKGQDFEQFEFVSDYQVQGLTNQYHGYGLGVPLIAVRKRHDSNDPRERFYPEGLSFPVTALLRVHPERQGTQPVENRYRATLELYDPLEVSTTRIGASIVPLESDLTTPLAYFLDRPTFGSLSTLGLLRPDRTEPLRGLYMVRPYEPGKIPVLMVHGLWSSPLTWMEMFNDLGSEPALRQRYQFWFYLYATGNPLWVSAAELRRDLAEARRLLDPAGRDASLEQMVIVGHSMGGLLGRLQTVDGGDEYWQTVSREPIESVKAEPEVRQALAETFYFRHNPAIKRLVTIGTPHRGSNFSNDTTRWLFRRLTRVPQMLIQTSDQLYRDNPHAFPADSLLTVRTGVDSLAPSSPILPVIHRSPTAPGVRHHNIVGVVSAEKFLGKLAGKSDGVVTFDSAHLDDVNSEIVVDADHVHVHRHPLSVLEVRRILYEHLADVERQRPVVFAHTAVAPPSAPGGRLIPVGENQPPFKAAVTEAGWQVAPVLRAPAQSAPDRP